MISKERTHTCGVLRKSDVGKIVTLTGWVHRRRDHGGLIFIDLRDRFGLTQIVFKPQFNPALIEEAGHLRTEWVIAATGKVIPRAEGMVNPNLPSGEIEIEASELTVLSKAKNTPFSICDERATVHEDVRLKYRYLDIRRGPIIEKLIVRHNTMLAARIYLDRMGFLEITTPSLAKSTPEGARDYLVPSRIYPGSFYALPQSPQIFKQLLMVSGLDRYFQIATCFRDEDLRADRQPEFTQIDLEMSFGSQRQLFSLLEGLMQEIFFKCINLQIAAPFPYMTYQEAMEKYGTDKPDLRFGMEFFTLDDIVKCSSFSIFLDALKKGGTIKGFCVKGGIDISRKKIDEYTDFVQKLGLHGLSWMKIQEEGFVSSITKYFDKTLLDELVQRANSGAGDLLFFGAGPKKTVNQALDHLRRHIARERNLIPRDRYCFSWITDFPLFQKDLTNGSLACEHNPFTSPHPEDIHLLDSDPLSARSGAYDLVLNGYEIASGAIRIHDSSLQDKIFRLLNLSAEEIEKRFGFFVEALQFGTPPHLGAALGLDRLIMILTKTENIRDVIAFPKTQQAADLMTSAPSAVLEEQLTELKIHFHDEEGRKK